MTADARYQQLFWLSRPPRLIIMLLITYKRCQFDLNTFWSKYFILTSERGNHNNKNMWPFSIVTIFLFTWIVFKQCKEWITKLFQHPITQHIILLMKFLIFNILLPGMDIYTDARTGESFFMRGHFYWGFCTLLFVFLPFLARLVMFFFNIIQCFVKKIDVNTENFPNKKTRLKVLLKGSSKLLWHLPPISIIRSVFTKTQNQN